MWLFHGCDPSLTFLTAKGNSHDPGKRQPAGAISAPETHPTDENVGMLLTLLMATHGAAMECYRLGMAPDQRVEGRRESLGQANELVRSCAILMEAIERRRGTLAGQADIAG
jgi:hypothetical protein